MALASRRKLRAISPDLNALHNPLEGKSPRSPCWVVLGPGRFSDSLLFAALPGRLRGLLIPADFDSSIPADRPKVEE